jgi:eukaryotic-like serine/threonine-protein kinase
MDGFRIRRWLAESPQDAAEERGKGTTSRGFAERFGRREQVGHGGMGSVHRALDRELLRELAVKVLAGDSEAHSERFLTEAQITSQLDHPNIVPIHDVGTDDEGVPYLLMKLVRGETLDDILDRAGDDRLHPEKLEHLLRVLIKVCEAVSFAHSRGVVHRDIKPANIMVGPFGEVYLMDWGLSLVLPADAGPEPSRRIRTDRPAEELPSLIGTINYMSPEQVDSQPGAIDERTDIFLLGASLYHILTGRPPYDEGPWTGRLRKAMTGEVSLPAEIAGDSVPPRLAQIALRAMAVDPADRHPSVRAFQSDLEAFLRGTWHLPIERFRPGETIIREGEAGSTAYILVEGRCRVYKGSGADRALLREMGPGDAFGETAVVTDKPRTASVEAVDEVKVMVVTRDNLTEGLGLNSWIGSFVVALSERFRDVDDRLRKLEGELAEE